MFSFSTTSRHYNTATDVNIRVTVIKVVVIVKATFKYVGRKLKILF